MYSWDLGLVLLVVFPLRLGVEGGVKESLIDLLLEVTAVLLIPLCGFVVIWHCWPVPLVAFQVEPPSWKATG